MCSANPKPSPNPDPNQVLGPLQNIINDDRAAREKVAMQKQLHQEQAGLKSVTRKDLEIVGLAVEMDHGQLVLVKHSQVSVRVRAHPNPNPILTLTLALTLTLTLTLTRARSTRSRPSRRTRRSRGAYRRA